jgi:S-DNA-T family DNA segregation ATPase FtsK/SpoIIIE
MGEAIAALDDLRGEMDRRYQRLLAAKKRKVVPGDGNRTLLVVIDELAFYVANTDKKAAQGFSERLRDLVARARAAGIVVVAATQKPSSDLIPTALRDNFGYRLAHRCATKDASDTILGAGWSAEEISASSIDPRLRGVGFLIAEGGVPRRIRAMHLGDAAIAAVVAEASLWRLR